MLLLNIARSVWRQLALIVGGLMLVSVGSLCLVGAHNAHRDALAQFESHPSCSAMVTQRCFRMKQARVVFWGDHSRFGAREVAVVAGEAAVVPGEVAVAAGARGQLQYTQAMVPERVYEQMRSNGVTARLYGDKIIGLISQGVDYHSEDYPNGRCFRAWLLFILGIAAMGVGGAAVLGGALSIPY